MTELSLQKANFWKRISAWFLDVILLTILTTGFAFAISAILRYDEHNATLQTYYDNYYQQVETKYGIDFDISQEEYAKLSDEQKAVYKQAEQEIATALNQDEDVKKEYDTLFNYSLFIVGGGLFLSHMALSFFVPFFLRNGQTVGKKIFGLGVVRSNCVRLSNPVLFIRSILGQCTIEAMIPALLCVMIFFGVLGSAGTLTLLLLLALQIGVMIYTKTNSSIHDLLSDTVVVDLSSQKIFPTQEDLIAYKEARAAEQAEQAQY